MPLQEGHRDLQLQLLEHDPRRQVEQKGEKIDCGIITNKCKLLGQCFRIQSYAIAWRGVHTEKPFAIPHLLCGIELEK
jgi:hypothetical protein